MTDTAIRVFRHQKWRSLFLSELTYLAEEELEDMAPPLAEVVRNYMSANKWAHDQEMSIWVTPPAAHEVRTYSFGHI